MRDVIDPVLDMKGLSTAAAGGGGGRGGGDRATMEPSVDNAAALSQLRVNKL